MSRTLPRYDPTERTRDEQKLGKILLEVGEPAPTTTVVRATLAGDERRLRGIPAVARGVPGASPGTTPHHIR